MASTIKITFMFIAFSVASASTAIASGSVAADSLAIRENGSDNKVTFGLQNGQMVNYGNNENCGNNNHTTRNMGGRYFNHIHIAYTLPQTGIDLTLKTVKVTEDNIKAFWDNYYSGYTNIGGFDIKTNCHAYAFGYDTWIQDTTFIHADMLKAVTKWSDTEFLTNGSIHSISIDAFSPGSAVDVMWTIEKNGPSDEYRAKWTYLSPSTATDKKAHK